MRLLRVLTVPGTALVLVACGTGSGTVTVTPAPASTPDAAAAAPVDVGFPTGADGPVLDAARSFVTTVTTYDHTKLGDQLKAVLPLTANPLQKDLRSSLAPSGDFAKTVQDEQRDATGNVLDLGMVSREGNRAVVLVFVDQKVTSSSDQQIERLRERVTLTATNGKWLATKLETV